MNDDCTDDADSCPCPDCVTWRDNRESEEPDFGAGTFRQQYEAAWHNNQRLT
jgi:hypothetical protein